MDEKKTRLEKLQSIRDQKISSKEYFTSKVELIDKDIESLTAEIANVKKEIQQEENKAQYIYCIRPYTSESIIVEYGLTISERKIVLLCYDFLPTVLKANIAIQDFKKAYIDTDLYTIVWETDSSKVKLPLNELLKFAYATNYLV